MRCVSRVMKLLGYPNMIMRYDQESSLHKVVHDVKLHHGEGVQLMPEERPKGESGRQDDRSEPAPAPAPASRRDDAGTGGGFGAGI